jgi:hypothetical protein
MSRFLIVAHHTALTTELQAKVRALAAGDPQAEFTILVPEDPNQNYSWEGESVDVAQLRAEAASDLLRETTGVQVTRAVVGADDPLKAIADELAAYPGYDGLVICTLPLGVSRWLRMDIIHQATRRFGLPVAHVVARASRTEIERPEPERGAHSRWHDRTTPRST